MKYEVRLEASAGSPIAVVHRQATRPQIGVVVQAACGVVWNALRAAQVVGVGRHVAIYWDDTIRLDVGAEVAEPFAGAGEVVGATLPQGMLAAVTHFGPYDQLGGAHQVIQAWCSANGHRLAGPSWEIYGHWQDEWNRDAALIRTDVHYLLADSANETRD
ncbi:GyrI-like domain-containing protein [Lacipirellula sp.]|uniref:GyrI-like domain-containing protein n=1 Tax=Lacipirellula sp. TaxID=2691419 RepID=UPI003D10B629